MMIIAAHRKRLTLLLLLLMAGQLAYYLYGPQTHDRPTYPKAQAGVLDLSGWDFAKDGPVPLDGEWEFAWNRLSPPGGVFARDGYFAVPGQWSGQAGGASVEAKGAATYRLTIRLAPQAPVYGVRVSYVRMASRVYADGEAVGGSGSPGLSRETYRPENKPFVAYFPVKDNTLELTLQAANFDLIQGGVTDSLIFGPAAAIQQLDRKTFALEMTVIIALLLLGIYHLAVYAGRTREKGFLYFGLYAVSASLAFAGFGSKLFMQTFDGLPIELSYKLQTIALYVALIMLSLFVRSLCPELIPRKLVAAATAFFCAYIGLVLILPFRIYTPLNVVFNPLLIVMCALLIWFLSAGYVRGHYGGFSQRGLFTLIVALCSLFVSMIDSGLFLMGMVQTYYLCVVSTLVFAIMAAYLLALRFSEAYATIEDMSRRLLDQDKMKDEFLAVTSHEFQTPLSGIIHLSDFMLKGGGGPVTDKQKRDLSAVFYTARRLSLLVRDIVDLESMKRNEVRLTSAALHVQSSVAVTLDILRFAAQGKPVELINAVTDEAPAVWADENRFRQILFNLVGNSVKFTERGTVRITSEAVGGQVIVRVEDTGIGIPPDRLESIFQPYEQGDRGMAEQYGGTGLGLFVSRKLARLMGGSLRVEWSAPGAGSRFALTLPATGEQPLSAEPELAALAELAAAAQPELPDTEQAAGEPAMFCLLAVDDEPSNLQVLANLFAGTGCRLLTAASGPEALALVRSRGDIDLVLLDVMMPRMSGYEVCRRLRENFSLFDLPVVLLTARNTPEDIAAGFEAGANDFVVKPFEGREVRSRVQTLLHLKQSVRERLIAETSFLRSQIKPHFLYNALNAIAALCYTDSARAAELIARLGVFLRGSFDLRGRETFVRLDGELALIEAYVAIEQARFDERLVIEYEIDPALRASQLPPLTIQPLVENAIRHGLMRREEGGLIRLSVKPLPSGGWRVTVWDNGAGMPKTRLERLLRAEPASGVPAAGGIGLINIDRRLRSYYGEGLVLESEEGQWTRVSFRIPAEDEREGQRDA